MHSGVTVEPTRRLGVAHTAMSVAMRLSDSHPTHGKGPDLDVLFGCVGEELGLMIFRSLLGLPGCLRSFRVGPSRMSSEISCRAF